MNNIFWISVGTIVACGKSEIENDIIYTIGAMVKIVPPPILQQCIFWATFWHLIL
jgi:hypothetical protein